MKPNTMSQGQLRKRGVAVVLRQGRVLLVRDRGKHKYSLPGGGAHDNERSYEAAARELYEETGLRTKKSTYIGSFNGAVSEHKAFLIEAEGHVHLKQHGELGSYLWWNMRSDVPVFAHVRAILAMVNKK
ncbi:MAG: NUDIX domain-containing protein [Dehalococcoidia bacterium]